MSDISIFVWLVGPCVAVRMSFPPEPYISGEGRDQKTEMFCRETRGFCFPAWLLSKTSCLLCPAAVLWCSGSHIYGVSEGQWRLLPGSARCLCRRVNCQPHHPSNALEPPEGRLPEPALTWPGWGNSTRCTLPLSASTWPESRWNQPCFFFFPFLFFNFIPKKRVFELFPIIRPCPATLFLNSPTYLLPPLFLLSLLRTSLDLFSQPRWTFF